jgi:pectinesterase inhibitor-like protein
MTTATMTSITSLSTSYTNIVQFIGLLSVLFVVSDVSGEPPSVVPSACKSAYAAGGGSFTEDFCLSALNNGHSAGAADNADLALIAVDLTTANATATEAKIDTLLGSSSAGEVSEGLLLCRELYDAVVHVYQPQCHAAGKDGRYVDGKLCLRRTVQAPVECERWFEQQQNISSPVTKEDDNLVKLANLAIALASIA